MQDGRGGEAPGSGSHEPKPGKDLHTATTAAQAVGAPDRPDQDDAALLLELMALPQCAARLALPTELGGRAPALVSLKRWSAAGVLQSAQHFPAGRNRPLYDYQAVKAICQSKLPMRFDEAGQAAAALAPPGTASTDLTPVLERLAGLEAALQAQASQQQAALKEISTHLAKLSSAAENLEHTRRSLMTRYDAEMTTLRTRIEQLQSAARESTGPGIDLAAARLSQAASRIEQALLALKTPSDQR